MAITLPFLSLTVFSADSYDEDKPVSLENLFNIKVTVASKKVEKISDAPGIIYVVTHDEIQRTGAITLKELLNQVPSLGLSSMATISRSVIVMRGENTKANSSHILFLINGRPIREVSEGGSAGDVIESFPVNIIEQIEVIRGPGSVLYGSDAFSGVINIKTRKSTDKPLSASLTGHYEPKNGGGSSAEILINTGDLRLAGAVRYYQKPDLKVDYNKRSRSTENGFMIIDNDTVGYYTIPDDKVIDQGPGVFVSADYKGISAMASFVEWKTSTYQNGTDVTNHKYFSNLGYTADISKIVKSEVNATYVRTGLDTEKPDFIEAFTNNILVENTLFITLLTDLNILFGGTASYIDGQVINLNPRVPDQPVGTVISDGSRTAFSAYGQADYTVFNQLKLIGGVQVNKKRKVPKHIAPRIGGIWNPNENISVKTFYSEAFRFPSLHELYMKANIGLFGNENLRPEVIKTTDVGISYQNDILMIGATYFHTVEYDIIQYRPSPDNPFVNKYKNFGTFTFNGVELEGKMYLTRNLYLNGSLLYQYCADSLYKVAVPYAHLGGKGGISYIFPQGITLSLFNAYQGDVPDKFKGKLNRSDDHINHGPFSLLNFSSKFNISKLFTIKSAIVPSVLFKVDNIIGKEIWMYEYGGYSDDVVPLIRGREFYIGVNLEL